MQAGIVGGIVTLAGLVLRFIGPWRKQITEAEAQLRTELTNENHVLLDRIEKIERKLERERQRHNAERSLDRHRLNNMQACFDATLLLLEMNPDRAAEVVSKIKEMRAVQMIAEAEEKAIIRAAEIAADEGEMDHDGN